MKKYRPAIERLLALCLFLLAANPAAFAQTKPIADLHPTVILISIDGFRSDYLDKYEPPNLRQLAREGVRARWMTPSFPSKTFPNHYAIVTGLYPQNNGIVENNIYDPATHVTFTMDNRKEVSNGRWWLGEPVWVTAEKQGQRTAAMFFPGSEAEIAGKRPTFWKPYDGKVPNEARVDTVLAWLDLPARERPTFFTLYFSDVDSAGHEFSPDAVEVKQAVFKVDRAIGHLIAGLKARGIYSRVNLIIVSDHGMAKQEASHFIFIDKLFDTGLAEKALWTGEIVGIWPKAGKEDEIYNALKTGLPPQAKVYHRRDVPARFHYSDSPRIPPLLVLPDEGWVLITQQHYTTMMEKGEWQHARGGHGYDNQLPSMRALFIAHGEAIKRDKVIGPFENVQVYNLMCAILKLKPAPNDGNWELAKEVLNDSRGLAH